MIKILLPLQHEVFSYEGVWVKELSANTGEIDNLPVLTEQYRYKDIIEFDPETHEATRLIQNGGYTPTEAIRYRGKFEDAKAKLESEGYAVEGIETGIMAVTKYMRNRTG